MSEIPDLKGRDRIDVLLNENEVAEILKVSVSTVRSWRFKKVGPIYVKLAAGTVRYTHSAISEYIAKNEVKMRFRRVSGIINLIKN